MQLPLLDHIPPALSFVGVWSGFHPGGPAAGLAQMDLACRTTHVLPTHIHWIMPERLADARHGAQIFASGWRNFTRSAQIDSPAPHASTATVEELWETQPCWNLDHRPAG
jgi:hypothetical protein